MSLEADIFAVARYAGAAIPQKPKLAPWIVSADLDDGRIQFRGAFLRFTLPSGLYTDAFKAVVSQLDGLHTTDAIIRRAEAESSVVDFLLRLMAAHGLLLPGDSLAASPSARLRFFSQISSAQAISGLSLMATKPNWLVSNDVLKKWLMPLLKEAGIMRIRHVAIDGADLIARLAEVPEEESGAPDLLIVITSGPVDTVLYEVNEYCLTKGIRWITANLNGPSAQLGPTFVPHQTACYTCFKTRLSSNSEYPAADRVFETQMRGKAPPSPGRLDAFTSVLLGQLALECVRLSSGVSEPTTIGRFIRFDALTAESETHNVWRVPRCKSCGRTTLFRQMWDINQAEGIQA